MNPHAELAIAEQAFQGLLALCEPRQVKTWNPSEEQRDAYVRFAERALAGLERFERIEQRQLLSEGRLQSFVPEAMLAFIREQMKPHIPDLRAALDHLDPDGKPLRDLFDEVGRAGGASSLVKGTFEEGLQQVYQLIDRKPEWEDDEEAPIFLPDAAYEILDSKLINFEPDAWLDRARELLPVRTTKSNVVLPSHVRLRLEELFRAYVFGCWLSVLGLCRSILEYAVLDNLHKFSIEPSWPPDRDGKRREKKLSHLIEEISEKTPLIKEHMKQLRDYGNDYLHPKKSQVSKESMFQRQAAAKAAVTILVQVVESLYLARKETYG